MVLDLLGPELAFIQDKATHGLIEPSRSMTLDELQKALAATQADWKKA